MTTQSIPIQPRDGHRSLESTARRIRRRRRQSAALAAGQNSVAATAAESPDRPGSGRPAGGGQILRRWSVADLIARAGGAPRAFA